MTYDLPLLHVLPQLQKIEFVYNFIGPGQRSWKKRRGFKSRLSKIKTHTFALDF